MYIKNPILRGMYPDPSICEANGKFYMVTSTFQYFPGVPLFESEDCINWKQIGHCLTRKSQLLLDNAGNAGGIYAPTIRFHNGRFYMVVTNVNNIGNFYVYTDDIYGEWSEPILVKQDGIDPSLYFEGDKTYFVSNGSDKLADGAYIQICEIDIQTGEELTESKVLWQGTGGRYLEAPHLYKFGAYYYLLESEGGTEYGHMINYARSKTIWGPYESYAKNPVLTNRNLGGYQLQAAGHGDIVQDTDGNWWMVHLAFRQIDRWQPFHHLGRETCLEPVVWDADGWFSVADGTARLEVEVEGIDKVQKPSRKTKTFDNLSTKLDWCYLRNPEEENYRIEKDRIFLKGTKVDLNSILSPTFIGIRQDEMDCEISVLVENHGQEAGLTFYQSENHHYDLFVRTRDGQNEVVLRSVIGQVIHEMKVIENTAQKVMLKCKADPLYYNFYVESDTEEYLGKLDTRYLSSEVACGFTGVFIGLYAYDPSENDSEACFEEFHLEE